MLIRFAHRPLTHAVQPCIGVRHLVSKGPTQRRLPKARAIYRLPSSYTIVGSAETTKTQALSALKDAVNLELRDLNHHRDHTDPRYHNSNLVPIRPRGIPGGAAEEVTNTRWRHNAAVILASKSFASWLEDPTFIREVLKTYAREYKATVSFRILGIEEPLPGSEVDEDGRYVAPPPESTTVLTAAVDSIPLQTAFRNRGLGNGFSAEGISVLFGRPASLLPNIWENAGASPQNDPDVKAGLTFKLYGQLGGGSRKGLDVTLPVANTVFHNGRSSTMFVSRWSGDTWADYRQTEVRDVTRTGVRPFRYFLGKGERAAAQGTNDSLITIPALPITKLVEIKSGLGNIIKRVLVQDEVRGASDELESVIPDLLQARERLGMPPIKGAIGVWALIVPARVMKDSKCGELIKQLNAGLPAFSPTTTFRPLLEAGCRMHRVLSGGGGWGDKKGLLSLDPETKFSTTDEEDISDFARAFMGMGTTESDTRDSMVQEDDWVSFFVDAETYPLQRRRQPMERDSKERLMFCVDLPESDAQAQPLLVSDKQKKPIVVCLNYFGAASAKGVFVGPGEFSTLPKGAADENADLGDSRLDTKPENGEGKLGTRGVTYMKIDTPGAEVSVGNHGQD